MKFKLCQDFLFNRNIEKTSIFFDKETFSLHIRSAFDKIYLAIRFEKKISVGYKYTPVGESMKYLCNELMRTQKIWHILKKMREEV